jgi:thiol-disulfide isomerase/thioredoxin
MKILLVIALAVLPLASQTPDPAKPDPQFQEQYELSQAVGEAGSSPVDVIRALEAHLSKYPDTKQRAVIEQNLAKSAMDSNDNPRIILYGEKVLAAGEQGNTKDNMTLLDRVTRALLDSSEPEQARKALAYARRYENDVIALRSQTPPGHLTPGQWADEADRAQARALALEAHAVGNLDGGEAGAKIALKSWDAYPTGEGAREVGYWLIKLKRDREAIEYYANAFTLEDAATAAADRAKDRKRLGDLYAKLNGSEKGLGDVILEAYDRTSSLMDARRAVLKARDPNAVAANVVDFILPAVSDGAPPLALSSLKGKTVVMDFWATWCVPCRAQQPLIENVKKHFEDAKDIVFLAVDADDEPSLAAPFAKQQGWVNPGYFEAGLAQKLIISAIPTVLVLDSSGQIFSRITGFIPERFEQMLTQLVEDARRNQ